MERFHHHIQSICFVIISQFMNFTMKLGGLVCVLSHFMCHKSYNNLLVTTRPLTFNL